MNQETNEPQPENAQPAPAQPKRAKKVKPPSRGERFVNTAQDLLDAIGDLRSAWEEHSNTISDLVQELQDIQQEYSDWHDNLPENLQQSATADKLETIVNIDIGELDEPDFDTLESAAQECLDADLPLGFGRD